MLQFLMNVSVSLAVSAYVSFNPNKNFYVTYNKNRGFHLDQNRARAYKFVVPSISSSAKILELFTADKSDRFEVPDERVDDVLELTRNINKNDSRYTYSTFIEFFKLNNRSPYIGSMELLGGELCLTCENVNLSTQLTKDCFLDPCKRNNKQQEFVLEPINSSYGYSSGSASGSSSSSSKSTSMSYSSSSSSSSYSGSASGSSYKY